jgi:hypothetical protein
MNGREITSARVSSLRREGEAVMITDSGGNHIAFAEALDP